MSMPVMREVMSYRSLKNGGPPPTHLEDCGDSFSSLATAVPRNHRKGLKQIITMITSPLLSLVESFISSRYSRNSVSAY